MADPIDLISLGDLDDPNPPFTEDIMNACISRKFKMSTIKAYDGTGGPTNHVENLYWSSTGFSDQKGILYGLLHQSIRMMKSIRMSGMSQHECCENTQLRNENEKFCADNIRYKEDLNNASCPNCGGPGALGEMSFDEQHLRIENARLGEEGTKKAYKRKLHVYKKGKARMVESRIK
ncbi:hypothetical protein AgCh_040205 [Apium graveolens]